MAGGILRDRCQPGEEIPLNTKKRRSSTMMNSFFKDEAGASAVEYSLLLALIAMVVMGAVTTLGKTLSNMFIGFSDTIVSYTGS